jgi:hypothetical protein
VVESEAEDMSERYRGCWVDPRAYELADGSGWSAEVYVAEDVGSETIDTRWILNGKFPTREVALEAAAATGRREVDKRVKDNEIRSVIEQETRLPSTHQHGFGSTDDVAAGTDGMPTKVHTPENPEDRFS